MLEFKSKCFITLRKIGYLCGHAYDVSLITKLSSMCILFKFVLP